MLAHEEAAQADAMPPGKVVVTGGGPDRWMAEPALAPAGTSRAAAQASAAASQIGMSLAAFIACSFCCCLSPFGGRVAPHKRCPTGFREISAQARRGRPGTGASFLPGQEGQPGPADQRKKR